MATVLFIMEAVAVLVLKIPVTCCPPPVVAVPIALRLFTVAELPTVLAEIVFDPRENRIAADVIVLLV